MLLEQVDEDMLHLVAMNAREGSDITEVVRPIQGAAFTDDPLPQVYTQIITSSSPLCDE